jgi:hypothetical protein
MHNFYREKSSPIICAIYVIFTKNTQSKQSPNSRKFTQSGHPACEMEWPPSQAVADLSQKSDQ